MKILGLTFCPYGTEKSVVLRGLTLIDNKGTKLSSVQKHVVQKNKQHKPEARDKQLEQKKHLNFLYESIFVFTWKMKNLLEIYHYFAAAGEK